MSTRLVIERELARQYYEGKYFPVAGTATGGGTTSLIDTAALVFSSGDSNFYDGKFVYREATAETTRVTRGGYAGSTGTLTLSPAITAFANTNLYQILDDPPAHLQNAINRVLRNLYAPSLWPLTSHIMASDDNDMETAPATSYSQSNGTRAAETTIVYRGTTSLKLTASATGGYANTGSISVQSGKQYYVSAMCYVTSGDSATLRVVDVTNSNTSIDTATTDEPAWIELAFWFTAPSGCEQIDIRLISDANTDVCYWDDLILLDTSQREFNLPSWIKYPSQIKGVKYLPRGSVGPTGNHDYRTGEFGFRPWAAWKPIAEDIRGNQPVRLYVDPPADGRLYVECLRPLAELSSDTSTTNADLDLVVAHSLYVLRNPDKAEKHLRELRQGTLNEPVKTFPDRAYVHG